MEPPPANAFDTILILDFGSQYSHLITRRLRELNVYSELLPCTAKVLDLSWKPKGIILSGSPYSVYDEDAPSVDPAVFELEIPILGICYGLQTLAWTFARQSVAAGDKKEYGKAQINIEQHKGAAVHVDRLFNGLDSQLEVWMSHGDKLSHLPDGFLPLAATTNAPFAAIAHEKKPYYGIQFHPEVTHTPQGTALLKNFAVDICEARQHWTMDEFVPKEIARIRALVGEKGQVIGAVSGGVDSTVAACLVSQAIGERFHAVLVDNGLLRLGEAQDVEKTLSSYLKINLTVVDASQRFLHSLKGVTEPEEKRRVIGRNFIEVFQETAKKIEAAVADSPEEAKDGNIEWLLQGTLYPDVIESISYTGPSQTIKTHHNVGGLPASMHLKLIEPLNMLFKDEVRELGLKLGMPEHLVFRHPFPGPGLGIRITGEVTANQLDIARRCDRIFLDEIQAVPGLYRSISQAFAAVLGGVKAVGVVGDQRSYQQCVVLRAVQTKDYMTATACNLDFAFVNKVSSRIINEVRGVSRVFLDVTSKPPATIELE